MSYTIEQAKAVMAETARLLAKDARRNPNIGTARAFATTRPPELEFADVIVRLQTENPDLSLPEAVRAAAIEEPTLHKKWVEKENTKMQIAEQEKKDSAARVRNRNR